MKNILVTGGCGYIGTTLVPKLVKKGFNVTVLDNFTFNQQVFSELYKFKNFELIKGDVREQNLIRNTNADPNQRLKLKQEVDIKFIYNLIINKS